MAQFAWSIVHQLLGCNWCPASFAQFFKILSNFSGRNRRLLWTLFAAQSWALWNIRNKLSIERKAIRHPADLIFKIVILLQLWEHPAKTKDKSSLAVMAHALRSIHVAVKPSDGQ
jgi:hypothetical protein